MIVNWIKEEEEEEKEENSLKLLSERKKKNIEWISCRSLGSNGINQTYPHNISFLIPFNQKKKKSNSNTMLKLFSNSNLKHEKVEKFYLFWIKSFCFILESNRIKLNTKFI